MLAFVGNCAIVKRWTLACLDHLLSEKNLPRYIYNAVVMMLDDVKAYLVACIRWPIHCSKQQTEVFPLRSAR